MKQQIGTELSFMGRQIIVNNNNPETIKTKIIYDAKFDLIRVIIQNKTRR